MVTFADPASFAKIAAGSRALSDRGIALDIAERIARDAEPLAVLAVAAAPEFRFASRGDPPQLKGIVKASMRDALGWALLRQGKVTAAKMQLENAIDFDPANALPYFHLGQLREMQNRMDDAELSYARGMTATALGANPNRAALESVYQKRHGSLEGWPQYLLGLEGRERALRRKAILQARIARPVSLTPFRLVTTTGDTVMSAVARGKPTVLHFWGTWCPPCVEEMPEVRQFYDKYARDSGVVVLTISNDKDLQDLKRWLIARGLRIPVLFDDGYTSRVGVQGWPTTWFVGASGRIEYSVGSSPGRLVEEWSWRIEALKAEAQKPSP
jgi:thiol-disulfide isomerase/thioredoxin